MGVDGRALDSVIEAFARHRLFSLDRDPETREPTVEVAHEALLREWIRLRGWIDAARDDLRTERRLAAAAAEWEAGGRDPSFLLRGSRLEQLSMWAAGTNLALAQAQRDYLDQSVELAEAERMTEEARRSHEIALERRSVRRSRAARRGLRRRGAGRWLLTVSLATRAGARRRKREMRARGSSQELRWRTSKPTSN